MKLWIARDKCGDLWLYSIKPQKYDDKGFFDTERIAMELPTTEFSKITFDNSPQEVELKLKNELSFEEMEELIDDLI